MAAFAFAAAAPPPSGKLVIYEGSYAHVTLSDLIFTVLGATACLLFVVWLFQLHMRVADLEFQVAALAPEERRAVDEAMDEEVHPPENPPAGRRAKSPARAPSTTQKLKAKAAASTVRRPNIDLNDPHAVRAALFKRLGVTANLPAKRQALLELFEATFPP